MAMAVVTQESMPPLSRTIAVGLAGLPVEWGSCGMWLGLDALGRGVPDEFVELEAEANGQGFGEDPLSEFARAEAGPGAIGVGKNGREEESADAGGEVVGGDEVASELEVAACRDDELKLVVLGKRVEIRQMEGVWLA